MTGGSGHDTAAHAFECNEIARDQRIGNPSRRAIPICGDSITVLS